MSLYLALVNAGVKIPAFVERKVGDLMPGSIDDVQVANETISTNMYLNSLSRNIQDFARAQLNNEILRVSGAFYNVFQPTKVTRTFEIPVAAFAFESLSDDERTTLRSLGLVENNAFKNMYIGSPPPDSLPSIFQMSIDTNKRLPPGHVSAEGYLAYVYALKGFQIFSSLMNYARVGTPNFCIKGVDMHEGKADDEMNQPEIYDLGASEKNYKFTSAYGKSGYTRTIFESPTAIVSSYDSTKKLRGEYLDVAVLEEFPSSQGLFCPYFEGMVLPDKSMITHIFSTMFFRALGKDADTAMMIWKRVRSGFKKMAFSSGGRALSHLYFGIKLASEGGNGIYAILQHGVYKGFVLAGPCSLILHGVKHVSVSKEELLREIGKVNDHGAAIKGIIALLNGIKGLDGAKEIFKWEETDLKTSRDLVRIVQSYDEILLTTDIKDKINEFCESMAFGERYAPYVVASMLDSIAFISTGDMSRISKYPAQYRGGYVFCRSRVELALGIYGDKAPSLNTVQRGRTFIFPGAESSTDPNLQVVDEKRRLQYLPFGLEPLRQAVAQWNAMFRDGAFTISSPRKGKEEFTDKRNVSFYISESPGFEEAYRGLRNYSNFVKGKSGLKRKNVENVGDATGSSSKKPKRNFALDI